MRPVRAIRLTGALLAGYGANMLVPLGISPLVRSWLVARREHLAMSTVLGTTAIARFLDGVVFALFAGLAAAGSGLLPQVSGNLALGLGAAGVFNLLLFGGLLWALFRLRRVLACEGPWLCRAFDRAAGWFRRDGPALRAALCRGLIWPTDPARQRLAVLAAVLGKLVAATHYFWAGLAVGVVLRPFDYLFLMVFAGFSLVLARFIRVPGGFVVGSALALRLLGVPDEQAVLMILFNHGMTTLLVVGVGLTVLWRSGLDVRAVRAGRDTGPAPSPQREG